MIELTTTSVLELSDASDHDRGRVRIESIKVGLVLGDFEPGPDYTVVESVFRFFADVVEQQSFSFLDEAEAGIRALGVTIRTADEQPVPVHDVQIDPDGGFSCRLPRSNERNGAH